MPRPAINIDNIASLVGKAGFVFIVNAEEDGFDLVVAGDVAAETARATAAEAVLQDNIDAEQTRAEAAEGVLQAAVDAEQARAEAAEALKFDIAGGTLTGQVYLVGGGAGTAAITVDEAQALVNSAPPDVAVWTVASDAELVTLSYTPPVGPVVYPTVGDLAVYSAPSVNWPGVGQGNSVRLIAEDYTLLASWTPVAIVNTTTVAEGTNLYFTATRVRTTVLTGYAVGTDTAVLAADTVLEAIQKLQGQLLYRLRVSNNLSDVDNAATSLANLGGLSQAYARYIHMGNGGAEITGDYGAVDGDSGEMLPFSGAAAKAVTIDAATLHAAAIAAGGADARFMCSWSTDDATGLVTFGVLGGVTLRLKNGAATPTATANRTGTIFVRSATLVEISGTV